MNEREMQFWREDWEERAAILEFDAGMSRIDAEAKAKWLLEEELAARRGGQAGA